MFTAHGYCALPTASSLHPTLIPPPQPLPSFLPCLLADWRKTDDLKKREELLLKELVNIVNLRDEIVQELDFHERG